MFNQWSFWAVCALMICPLGCQPAGQQEPYMFPEIEKIEWKRRELAWQEKALGTEDLRRSLGEPEKKMSIAELVELVRASKPEDPNFAEDTMRHVYHIYGLKLPGPMPSKPWRESQRFNKLQVWLYRWEKPEKLRLGTALRTWTHEMSYFALVEGGDVIACGEIYRSGP